MSSGFYPVNRKDIRKEIAASLQAAMTIPLNVFGYLKTGFEGDSPIVRIMAAGSQRQEVGEAQGYESQFFFDVQILVLAYEQGANDDAISEAAADTLDDIELELFTWFGDNQQVQHEGSVRWTVAKWEMKSNIALYPVGTHFYLIETIPIIVEVAG